MSEKFGSLKELIERYFDLVKENLAGLPPYATFGAYMETPTVVHDLIQKLNSNDEEEKLKAITKLWSHGGDMYIEDEDSPRSNERIIHSVSNTSRLQVCLKGSTDGDNYKVINKDNLIKFANGIYNYITNYSVENDLKIEHDLTSDNNFKGLLNNNINAAINELLFWYYYEKDKFPIINSRAKNSRKILNKVFGNVGSNDLEFNKNCLHHVNTQIEFDNEKIITKQLLLDQLFYSIDEIEERMNYCEDENINNFYKQLNNTIKDAKCPKNASDRLKSYYDFFNKNTNVTNSKWYSSMKSWIDILQSIKAALGNELADINNINNIINDKSMKKLSDIDDLLNQFLFIGENGISNVWPGIISNEHKEEIKIRVKENPGLIFTLLKTDDPREASEIIDDILTNTKDYKVAKFRFLRALFPEKFTALDSKNKLSHLSKNLNRVELKIDSFDDIGLHNCLMSQIEDEDYIKKQIFFWELQAMLEDDLDLKQAIVYYGAPGTGKTYKAKEVAKEFINRWALKNQTIIEKELIETVQFHPSYSYEDFIEGIRPSNGEELRLKSGVFKKFCKIAGKKEIDLYRNEEFLKKFGNKNFSEIIVSELNEAQKEIVGIEDNVSESLTLKDVIQPAFFIIDEINRAELSRVFGELMYSLEYRGYEGKIKTQYSYLNTDEKDESVFYWEEDENWFFIPQNVYIIGTMNNIDRSVDSFDFALRRRFMWEEVKPNYEVVRNEYNNEVGDGLADSLTKLNAEIINEELLGNDYQIGHSYPIAIKNKDFIKSEDAKIFLWNEFIKPLMQEYLRGLGNSELSSRKIKDFENAFIGVK